MNILSSYLTSKQVPWKFYGLIALNPLYCQLRYKQKDRFNDKNIRKALKYFDSVYEHVYDKRWEEIRNCLQTDSKYVAMLNNFIDISSLEEDLWNLNTYDVGAHYNKIIQNSVTKIKKKKDKFNCAEGMDTEISKPTVLNDPKPGEEKNITHYGSLNEPAEILSSRLVKGVSASNIERSSIFEHIPATKLKHLDDWIEETDPIRDPNLSNFDAPPIIQEESLIHWPETLKVFACPRGETVEFPAPLYAREFPVFTHYLFNGSSVLPVLALDVQMGDLILDLCSGPGGKAIALMQTMRPKLLLCNDVSNSRLNRVKDVFSKFIPKELSIWDAVEFSKIDGCTTVRDDYFDKVLVDAPCLNDRLSVQENDNNIFKGGRTHERLTMPELQASLIVSALKSVKPGGSVVYSTCTLSPLQNDGAVHLALSKVWKETRMEVAVIDMKKTMKHLSFLFFFGRNVGLRYGQLVLPVEEDNYGPMYVCKLIRRK